MICVGYDGRYPNACSGRLIVVKDGVEIYNESGCCTSTGSVSFDEDGAECVKEGELLWDDANKFPKDVQDAVSAVLSGVVVCCGGCV